MLFAVTLLPLPDSPTMARGPRRAEVEGDVTHGLYLSGVGVE